MSEKTNNIFSQKAMYYGTLLGLLWIAGSAAYIAGLNSSVFMLLSLAAAVASPFFAGNLAVKFRKAELNDRMNFPQAWLFVTIMYVCASLLTAVVHYIYFLFFDNGYLVQFITENMNTVLQSGLLENEQDIAAIKEAIALMSKISISDIVLSFLSSNIMVSFFISPLIAIFVKHTPKQ